jgi:AbrB family looped-hinge helix DNA binding protein
MLPNHDIAGEYVRWTKICHTCIEVTKVATVDTTLPPISARINANGRIVIPAEMRKRMGVAPGDTVLLTEEDGVLRVQSHRAMIRQIQEEFKKYRKPGVSMVDEFIADRHEEARREQEAGLA